MLVDFSENKPPPAKSFADVYADNAAFMWRSIRRLGVRDSDVEDVCQEAFLVAYRKLGDFHGGSMKAWLFAIGVRVAADHRRRAHVRREVTSDEVAEPSAAETQSAAIDSERAARLLESIIATLDVDKRAVFICYELEEMAMAEVAVALDCPLQTAYSRLHAARDHVTAAIERWHRREGSRA